MVVERLEGWRAASSTVVSWEIQAELLPEAGRFWFLTEGERTAGDTGAADFELFHAWSPGNAWDWVAGIKHEYRPGDTQNWVAIGIEGEIGGGYALAATNYVSDAGQLFLRLEIEREWSLGGKLFLQPRLEAYINGERELLRGLGAGLGGMEGRLRLRYKVPDGFAPYVAVVHAHALGDTARILRANGEGTSDTLYLFGLQFWF